MKAQAKNLITAVTEHCKYLDSAGVGVGMVEVSATNCVEVACDLYSMLNSFISDEEVALLDKKFSRSVRDLRHKPIKSKLVPKNERIPEDCPF